MVLLVDIICRIKGCDMQSRGGRNAGCSRDCACSVPVNECTRCGSCDYGNNAEARAVVAECHERNGKPADAMTDAELLAEAGHFNPDDHSELPWDEVLRRDAIRKEITRRGLSMPDAA